MLNSVPIDSLPMCPASGSGGRLGSMDVFKGLAISFIAVLHIAIVARAGMSELSPFLQALYLGLVGFFVMSGYFFRPGRVMSVQNN